MMGCVVEDDATATTLAMRFLPPDADHVSLQKWVDDAGYKGQYDFLAWFPASSSSRHHCSYGYVNFRSQELACAFMQEKHGSRFIPEDDSHYPVKISPSSVQGFENNYHRYGKMPNVAALRSHIPFFDPATLSSLFHELEESSRTPELGAASTTVIVSNFPQIIETQSQAISWFDDSAGLVDTYNFLLLVPAHIVSRARARVSWRTPCDIYLIVNFHEASSASDCVRDLNGRRFDDGDPPTEVTYSTIQGYENLINHVARMWASGHISPWVITERPPKTSADEQEAPMPREDAADNPESEVSQPVALDPAVAEATASTPCASYGLPPKVPDAIQLRTGRPVGVRSTKMPASEFVLEDDQISRASTSAVSERDEATTLTIRNLPIDADMTSIRQWVDHDGFKGMYDAFVYLPQNDSSRRAYINFKSPALAQAFTAAKQGSNFDGNGVRIAIASVQGFEKTVQRFSHTAAPGCSFFDESAMISVQKAGLVKDKKAAGLTTVMVNRLPATIDTQEEAQYWLHRTTGCKGDYDFLLFVHPSIVEKSSLLGSGGCIIVNFITAEKAKECIKDLDGRQFPDSTKRIKAIHPKIQGVASCMEHFGKLQNKGYITPYRAKQEEQDVIQEACDKVPRADKAPDADSIGFMKSSKVLTKDDLHAAHQHKTLRHSTAQSFF